MSYNNNENANKADRLMKATLKEVYERLLPSINSDNVARVRVLLNELSEEKGIDISDILEYKDETSNQTLLVHALYMGNFDVATYLVGKPCDLKIRDDKGRNALMYAIEYYENNKELAETIIETIVDKGGLTDLGDENGITELMYAVNYRLPIHIIEYLIENGAKTTTRDIKGNTALMMATSLYKSDTPSRREYIDGIIKALLEPVPSVIDVQNTEGKTAIMLAIQNVAVYLLEKLLTYGPNVNIKDENGDTALKLASKLGYINMFELLLPLYTNSSLKNNALSVADTAVYRKYGKKTEFIIKPDEHIQIGIVPKEKEEDSIIKIPAKYKTVALFDIQETLENNVMFENICFPIGTDYLEESFRGSDIIILCKAGTEMIGIVLAELQGRFTTTLILHISAICTNPKYTRVGKQLMNIAKEICIESGIDKITLEPLKEVVEFYEKQNFVKNESNESGKTMKHIVKKAEGGRRRKTGTKKRTIKKRRTTIAKSRKLN